MMSLPFETREAGGILARFCFARLRRCWYCFSRFTISLCGTANTLYQGVESIELCISFWLHAVSLGGSRLARLCMNASTGYYDLSGNRMVYRFDWNDFVLNMHYPIAPRILNGVHFWT